MPPSRREPIIAVCFICKTYKRFVFNLIISRESVK